MENSKVKELNYIIYVTVFCVMEYHVVCCLCTNVLKIRIRGEKIEMVLFLPIKLRRL